MKSTTETVIKIYEEVGKQNLGKLADIIRSQVVAEYGGMYFDTDMALREYDIFIHKFDFFGFVSDQPHYFLLINAIFGAAPNHPIADR